MNYAGLPGVELNFSLLHCRGTSPALARSLARSLAGAFALVARKRPEPALVTRGPKRSLTPSPLRAEARSFSPLCHQAREGQGRVKLQTSRSTAVNPTTELDVRPCLSFACISPCKILNLSTLQEFVFRLLSHESSIRSNRCLIPNGKRAAGAVARYCQGGNKGCPKSLFLRGRSRYRGMWGSHRIKPKDLSGDLTRAMTVRMTN
jgi:hypothetical protein